MIVQGLDTIQRNLNKYETETIKRIKTGTQKSVLLVKSKALPLTPVKTGNLRNSAFTEVIEDFGAITGIIGYSASYALEVHEINKNYRMGQWKFLETALFASSEEIKNIFADELKI